MRRHGRKVWFAVLASTALAFGLTATILPAAAAASKPAAPAKPTATAMSLKAKVKWKAPAAHGSPIDSYTVAAFVGKTAKVTHVYKSKALTQVFSGLKNGTS